MKLGIGSKRVNGAMERLRLFQTVHYLSSVIFISMALEQDG